jgi:hypothetical protein
MENTIAQIFKHVTNKSEMEYLQSKLGVVKEINGEIKSYPNALFEKFLECKKQYESEVERLNILKEEAKKGDSKKVTELSISSSIYHRKIQFALQYWISNGYKFEVEKIISESK